MPLRFKSCAKVLILIFLCFLTVDPALAGEEMRCVVPGGQSVGVSLSLSGAYVDSLGKIETADGRSISPAEQAGIAKGDTIIAVNGDAVKTVDELKESLSGFQDGEEVSLTVTGGRGERTVSLTPVRAAEDNELKIGAWIKDAASGVGTITYYDPSTGEFAAIGHSIGESMTGAEADGDVYRAEIVGVRKGEQGIPGELIGVYSENKLKIGSIKLSNSGGIVGTVSNPENLISQREAVPIGSKSDAALGEAEILCCTEGSAVNEYKIEIVEICEEDGSGKDIIFKVTDEDLINKTGGIVRGMSGSPIIQNDKIIGSVTHVLINEPTTGYGIFIENMQN